MKIFNHQTSDLLNLPKELIIYIIEKLDNHSQISFARTCSQASDIVSTEAERQMELVELTFKYTYIKLALVESQNCSVEKFIGNKLDNSGANLTVKHFQYGLSNYRVSLWYFLQNNSRSLTSFGNDELRGAKAMIVIFNCNDKDSYLSMKNIVGETKEVAKDMGTVVIGYKDINETYDTTALEAFCKNEKITFFIQNNQIKHPCHQAFVKIVPHI